MRVSKEQEESLNFREIEKDTDEQILCFTRFRKR